MLENKMVFAEQHCFRMRIRETDHTNPANQTDFQGNALFERTTVITDNLTYAWQQLIVLQRRVTVNRDRQQSLYPAFADSSSFCKVPVFRRQRTD